MTLSDKAYTNIPAVSVLVGINITWIFTCLTGEIRLLKRWKMIVASVINQSCHGEMCQYFFDFGMFVSPHYGYVFHLGEGGSVWVLLGDMKNGYCFWVKRCLATYIPTIVHTHI